MTAPLPIHGGAGAEAALRQFSRIVVAAFAALVMAAILAGGMATATAGPASAHAIVTASTPADRTSLTAAPTFVSITFSENVSTSLGGLDVFDGDGRRVDNANLERPSADSLRIGLLPELADGTYIANYRVVSADGHPITGAIVFGIGEAVDETQAGGVSRKSDPGLEALGTVGRFLLYLGALGAAGMAFFLAFLGDDGPGSFATGRIVRRLSALAVFGSAITVAVQAALATGRGVGAFADPSVVQKVLSSGLGAQTAVLFAGLAAIVIVPVTRGIAAQIMALYGGLAACGAFVLWGHATEASSLPFAIVSDLMHVVTAALWFGGILALAIHVRYRIAGRAHPVDADLAEPAALATARLVVRFSTVAAGAVGALWVTGSVMAWQNLGSLDNLGSSGYGRALLAKLTLVAALVAIAGVNRFRLIPAIIDDVEPLPIASSTDASSAGAGHDSGEGKALVEIPHGSTPEHTATGPADAPVPKRSPGIIDASRAPAWGRLVAMLRLEVLGIVFVLAITGLLVNLTPPRFAGVAADQPFVQSAPLRRGTLAIVVSPARTGVNSIHLTYTGPDGRPIDTVSKATVELRLADKNIGPITRSAVRGGPGHFVLEGLTDFALPGTWTIAVQSRTGEFDVERTEFAVPILKS